MKIGIVTWFNVPNYGTFLQAYALQKFLSKKDFDVYLINYKSNSFLYADLRRLVFSLIPCLRKKNIYSNSKYVFDKSSYKYLKLSKRITKKNTYKLNQLYDFFISGSDQIWSPVNYKSKEFYMLDFYQGKNCISFSTSLGGNDIPENEKEIYYQLLKKYSYVSVRENSSKLILEALLGRDIECLCDPTFLLTKEEWQKQEVKPKSYTEHKYIFCYFLGNKSFYKEKLLEIRKKYPLHKMKVVRLGNEKFELEDDFFCYENSLDPFEFLFLMNHSEFVVTDSFHATVFSIIFDKPFYHFFRFSDVDQTGQNIRVIELLKNTKTTSFSISSATDCLCDIDNFPQKSIEEISDKIEFSKKQLVSKIKYKEYM